MPDIFPYRFTATDGPYEGTTFIYLASGTVISYKTDSPSCYHRTGPDLGGGWTRWSTRHDMTPEELARFEAIPLRDAAA